MKKITSLIFSALAMVLSASATIPHYRVTVDFQKDKEPFQAFGYQSSEAYYDIYFYNNGVPLTNSTLTNVVFAYQPFANNKNLIYANQTGWTNGYATMHMASSNMFWPCKMANAQISFTNGSERFDFRDGYMTVQKSLLHMNPPSYPGYDLNQWMLNAVVDVLPLGAGLAWVGGKLVAGGSAVDLSFTNNYYLANNPSNYCTEAYARSLTNGLDGDVTWRARTNTWNDVTNKLPSTSTNGWEIGPHSGLATTGNLEGATNSLWDDILALTNLFEPTVDWSFTNAFGTASQGSKADTAIQPATLSSTSQSDRAYSYGLVFTITTNYTSNTNIIIIATGGGFPESDTSTYGNYTWNGSEYIGPNSWKVSLEGFIVYNDMETSYSGSEIPGSWTGVNGFVGSIAVSYQQIMSISTNSTYLSASNTTYTQTVSKAASAMQYDPWGYIDVTSHYLSSGSVGDKWYMYWNGNDLKLKHNFGSPPQQYFYDVWSTYNLDTNSFASAIHSHDQYLTTNGSASYLTGYSTGASPTGHLHTGVYQPTGNYLTNPAIFWSTNQPFVSSFVWTNAGSNFTTTNAGLITSTINTNSGSTVTGAITNNNASAVTLASNLTVQGTTTLTNTTVTGYSAHSSGMTITLGTNTNGVKIVSSASQTVHPWSLWSSGSATELMYADGANFVVTGNMTNSGLQVQGNANVTNTLTAGTLINSGITNLNAVYYPVSARGGATTNTLDPANGLEQSILCTNATFITSVALSASNGATLYLFVDPTTNNYTVTWDTNVFNVGTAGWPAIGTNGADLVLRKCFGSTMWTVNGPTTDLTIGGNLTVSNVVLSTYRWTDSPVTMTWGTGASAPARKAFDAPYGGISALGFAANDYVDFTVQMPHTITASNATGYVEPHVHVTPIVTPDAGKDRIKLTLIYMGATISGTMYGPLTNTLDNQQIAFGKHTLIEFGHLMFTNFYPNISGIYWGTLQVSAATASNYYGTAGGPVVDIAGCDFNYPVDRLGSAGDASP